MTNTNPIIGTGIAVDIDETLSSTITHWVEQMQAKFGNPENLTIKELVEKYRYVQDVPYWQHEEALQWVDGQIYSNDSQEELPLIEGSSAYLQRINQIIPIVAYITARPQSVLSGTKNWLVKHNFPDAPIICRPENILHSDGNVWKAKTLEELYPQVVGIIDDNAKLLSALKADYRGKVFMYDHHDNLGFPFAVACKDWYTVYEEIKKFVALRKDFKVG